MDPYSFPASPTPGQLYPATVDVPGRTQYSWDNVEQVWNVVPQYVALNEVGVFNEYNWPVGDGDAGESLFTDGDGNLTWGKDYPTFVNLDILESIDGFETVFTLVELGTTTPFTPAPSTNIVVFLGGVPQIPEESFSVTGDQITFTEPPPVSTLFYAISNSAQ